MFSFCWNFWMASQSAGDCLPSTGRRRYSSTFAWSRPVLFEHTGRRPVFPFRTCSPRGTYSTPGPESTCSAPGFRFTTPLSLRSASLSGGNAPWSGVSRL